MYRIHRRVLGKNSSRNPSRKIVEKYFCVSKIAARRRKRYQDIELGKNRGFFKEPQFSQLKKPGLLGFFVFVANTATWRLLTLRMRVLSFIVLL